MTEEKPLHVRVAEALGCKPEIQGLGTHMAWHCTCQKMENAYGYPHDCVGVDGAPGEGGEIEHYDTDWSATGPLIEKYDIQFNRAWNTGALMAFRWDLSEPQTIKVWGENRLIAVCNLILALKEAGKL